MPNSFGLEIGAVSYIEPIKVSFAPACVDYWLLAPWVKSFFDHNPFVLLPKLVTSESAPFP